MLCGCDPAAATQHGNISQGTRGVGCPCSWRGWVVFLQRRKGWEKKPVHNFSWEQGWAERVWLCKFCWGGKERGCRLGWETWDRNVTCGNSATRSSDFSKFQGYVFTQNHVFPCFLWWSTRQHAVWPEKGAFGQTAQILLVKTNKNTPLWVHFQM